MTVVNKSSNVSIYKESENLIHSETQFCTSSTPDISSTLSLETCGHLDSHTKQCTHFTELDSSSSSSCFSFHSNETQEHSQNPSQTPLSTDTSSLSLKSESEEFFKSPEFLKSSIPLTHSLSAQNDTVVVNTIEDGNTEIVKLKPYVPLDVHNISVVSTPSLTPTLTKDNYEQKLITLSRLAWGAPSPNPLEIQKKETMAIHALRHSNVDILSQYESPFSTSRQKSRKRTISAILSTSSTVPHLDKRMLSSTYKISLENDKILAKNLGGWDTFFSLKGKLASIPRDQLEYLLLETCSSEPRLISRITDCSIEATNKMIFQSNHLPL